MEVIGAIVVAILAGVIGLLAGKRVNEKHTVVSDKDVMDGVVLRKMHEGKLASNHRQTLHNAQVESEKVSQQIKEAPNEEIVRMFIAAFDKPASERGRR